MARMVELGDLPDVLTLEEAARAVGMTQATLRAGIKKGKLRAFLPRGVTDPLRAGRGQGYRITGPDLESWYFNRPPGANDPSAQ